MRSLVIAMQFLSIIPVGRRLQWTEDELRASAYAYPLVGLIFGLVLIGCDAAFGRFFGMELTAALMLLVMVVLTGGLHMDGLADTFDALMVRGERERRLEVMRDSASGSAAVMAIGFVLFIKYLALLELMNTMYTVYYGALLFMPLVGRWAMLFAMGRGGAARDEGLGRVFMGRLSSGAVWASVVIVAAVMAVGTVLGAQYAPEHWWIVMGATVLPVMVLVAVFQRITLSVFGGDTGDTLGALCEITEATFLLWVTACSKVFI